MDASGVEAAEGGVRLRVRATTKAQADKLDGAGAAADGLKHLKVRVRAAPEDGKANAAICAVIAKALGAAKSSVSVERGATARIKIIHAEGDAALIARARALMEIR